MQISLQTRANLKKWTEKTEQLCWECLAKEILNQISYYKLDKIPEAILHYEKALKLQPDHEDALFNLKMANKRTIDKIDRLPDLFIGNTWKTLVTSKTVSSWAYYTVGLIFLSLLLFISYL